MGLWSHLKLELCMSFCSTNWPWAPSLGRRQHHRARLITLISMDSTSLGLKVAGGKGISEMKSKQQSSCSNCMHRPVMSWSNACNTCGDACTYCMGSEVSSLSGIYLYLYFVQGWFVKQKLMLSCNFRCDQIHNRHLDEFTCTLLCYLSCT